MATIELDADLQALLNVVAEAEGLDLQKYLRQVATSVIIDGRRDKKPPRDIRAGDELNGYTIKTVDYSNENYAIYRTTNNTLGFRIVPTFPFKKESETAYHEARRRVDSKLSGAYRNDSQTLLASCLDSCLRAGTEADKHFELVDEFIRKREPINCVYGVGTDWAVYTNNHDELVYEYPNLPTQLAPAITEFNRLSNISRLKLKQDDQKAIQRVLGIDLATSFSAGEQFNPHTHFLSSRDFINSKVEEKLRVKYLIGSVAYAVILFILAGLVTHALWQRGYRGWPVALGAVGGVLGVTISVMQRGGNLAVNPFVPSWQIVVIGLTRILLGMIFGSVLVVAVNANISMGMIKDNMWSLFIFTIVAGFSERFIPDVLESIGKTKYAKNE